MSEQYDGDSRESRTAFRNYDTIAEPVSSKTPWQIWRDACAWQARRTVSGQEVVAWIELCELEDEIFLGSGVTTTTLYKERPDLHAVPLYAAPIPAGELSDVAIQNALAEWFKYGAEIDQNNFDERMRRAIAAATEA